MLSDIVAHMSISTNGPANAPIHEVHPQQPNEIRLMFWLTELPIYRLLLRLFPSDPDDYMIFPLLEIPDIRWEIWMKTQASMLRPNQYLVRSTAKGDPIVAALSVSQDGTHAYVVFLSSF